MSLTADFFALRADFRGLTLAFQRVDDLIQAIGLPEDQVCTYCWTGKDHALTGDCAHVCSSCPHACGQ